jgi:hypothetical protein
VPSAWVVQPARRRQPSASQLTLRIQNLQKCLPSPRSRRRDD